MLHKRNVAWQVGTLHNMHVARQAYCTIYMMHKRLVARTGKLDNRHAQQVYCTIGILHHTKTRFYAVCLIMRNMIYNLDLQYKAVQVVKMAWIFADKDIWPGHDFSYLQELFEIISKRIIMHYDILMHCRLYHLC